MPSIRSRRPWRSQGGTTAGDGTYTIPQLPTAAVRVFFSTPNASPYLSEYYDDKGTFGSADSVSVTSGQNTPNINAQLALKSITVTSPNGGRDGWRDRRTTSGGHRAGGSRTSRSSTPRIIGRHPPPSPTPRRTPEAACGPCPLRPMGPVGSGLATPRMPAIRTSAMP